MANEIERILKERGFTKHVELEMPSFSEAFELRLYKIYAAAIRTVSAAFANDLVSEYRQELRLKDSVETTINSIDDRLVQALITFARNWRGWATDGTRLHYRVLVRRLKYATGVDLSTRMAAGGPQATLDDLLRWNTELIRNISEEMRQKISSAVYSGLTSRTPPEIIAKQISEATGMARARARRIASDQTVKLSSALDDQRMRELGVEGYQWMHSGKLHPRIEHVERNGDFIKFGSKIDKEDPPGHAPFCGCKRRMVIN